MTVDAVKELYVNNPEILGSLMIPFLRNCTKTPIIVSIDSFKEYTRGCILEYKTITDFLVKAAIHHEDSIIGVSKALDTPFGKLDEREYDNIFKNTISGKYLEHATRLTYPETLALANVELTNMLNYAQIHDFEGKFRFYEYFLKN